MEQSLLVRELGMLLRGLARCGLHAEERNVFRYRAEGGQPPGDCCYAAFWAAPPGPCGPEEAGVYRESHAWRVLWEGSCAHLGALLGPGRSRLRTALLLEAFLFEGPPPGWSQEIVLCGDQSVALTYRGDNMLRVILRIGLDGTTKVEVQGAKGRECHRATEAIEQAGHVLSDVETPEAYLSTEQPHNQSQASS